MTLPASGAISFNDINVESGAVATSQLSLDDFRFRNLIGGGAPNTSASLNSGYGVSFNGFYFYPRQISSTGWNIVETPGSRKNSQTRLNLESNGAVSATAPFDTLVSNSSPDRFVTPLTTSYAASGTMQVRIQVSSWTGTTTVGDWRWNVGFGGSTYFISSPGNSNPTLPMDLGWVNWNTPLIWSQALVDPGAAFDNTVAGTISMRRTATPAVVTTVPYSIRVYAL
jgi:hypothetical protein